MSSRAHVLLAAAALAQAFAHSAAAHAPSDDKPSYLSRFSDGPRRVAQARGAALVRAESLGIGSTDKVRPLLHSRAQPELLQAVQGEAPRDLLWPGVQGRFGRGFGFTRRVRTELPHNGVDIGAPEGTAVRAAADGLVVYSDNGLLGFGNCVMVLHKNGWLSLYAHQLRTTVQAGYFVKRGERIGLVGQTGYAWGPHLHFELRDNGKLRDPERLFVGRASDALSGPLVPLTAAAPIVPQSTPLAPTAHSGRHTLASLHARTHATPRHAARARGHEPPAR